MLYIAWTMERIPSQHLRMPLQYVSAAAHHSRAPMQAGAPICPHPFNVLDHMRRHGQTKPGT